MASYTSLKRKRTGNRPALCEYNGGNAFRRGKPMQKPNQKLDSFISEITSGEASPVPEGEELGGERIWSGQIAEIDQRTYCFYRDGNAGAPKMVQDDWFIFSDTRTVAEPGTLF